jgi:hypothetical protein
VGKQLHLLNAARIGAPQHRDGLGLRREGQARRRLAL